MKIKYFNFLGVNFVFSSGKEFELISFYIVSWDIRIRFKWLMNLIFFYVFFVKLLWYGFNDLVLFINGVGGLVIVIVFWFFVLYF